VASDEFVEALPTLAPAGAGWAGADGGPPGQALRRARAVTNEWSLRQQRILADLASVLNATDELSRASAEGEREAAELASVTTDLLTTVQ
jgi:hypothetical protein